MLADLGEERDRKTAEREFVTCVHAHTESVGLPTSPGPRISGHIIMLLRRYVCIPSTLTRLSCSNGRGALATKLGAVDVEGS
jgi:hypothetical protein